MPVLNLPALDFYFAPGACSLVSHIALEEAALAFSSHPLALMAGEHKAPDYLALNPSGKVPTLMVDGHPLAETLAILRWINEIRPEATLLPRREGPLERAQHLSLLSWFASTVHPVFTRFRVPPAIVADPSCFGKVAEQAAPVLASYFAIATARLGRGDWLLGDWSIADAYLFWFWIETSAAGFDAGMFPLLAAHAARVAERPATRRALAREALAVAEFERRGIAMMAPSR
jgi:glutathione S-transferase